MNSVERIVAKKLVRASIDVIGITRVKVGEYYE